MWLINRECKKEAERLWGGMYGGNFGDVKHKLNNIAVGLQGWGRRKYGCMDKKIKQLKYQCSKRMGEDVSNCDLQRIIWRLYNKRGRILESVVLIELVIFRG